ncbi:RDD family protein [Opitutaceae bacterium EW11]|nr:RDD family protein [Opitutaceae bacterium EW11]
MSDDRVQSWQVRTPEGVTFSYRLASPVLRAVALSIDTAVVAAAWSVVGIFLMLLSIVGTDVANLVAVVGYFLLSQGYRMIAEWRWRGQTLGKRLMRLRVVDERGLRLTFSQIALRNLLRFVDVLPGAYLVGGAAGLLSRRSQRLGDLAAGTLVIWEPPEPAPDPSVFGNEKYNSLRAHPPVVARLRQAVDPREARAAWQALARRERLDAEARVRLFSVLANHFRSLTPVPAEAIEGVSDEQFVRNVVDVLYVNRAPAGE